jgi:hypothetical protein
MNNKFDEFTKSMTQAVSRRAALKKFGLALSGMALVCSGLTTNVQADLPTPSLISQARSQRWP